MCKHFRHFFTLVSFFIPHLPSSGLSFFRVFRAKKGQKQGQKGAVEGARRGFWACHLYTFGGARGVSGACVMTDGEAENAFLKKRDFFFMFSVINTYRCAL